MKMQKSTKNQIIAKLNSGANIDRIAEEYTIPKSTLYFWRKKYTYLKSSRGTEITLKDYSNLEKKVHKVQTEAEILKRFLKYLDIKPKERMAFMDTIRTRYDLRSLCSAMDVDRGTYYNHFKRNKRDKSIYTIRRLEAAPHIQEIFYSNYGIFGANQISHELKRKYGIYMSSNTVGDIMKEIGLESRHTSKLKHNALSLWTHRVNILKQHFLVGKKNQVWLTDCKRVYTVEPKQTICICTIEDIFSRKIVGYAYGKSESTRLLIRALRDALNSRKPQKGLILHSDRGAAYGSISFNSFLAKYGIKHSYSRTSSPRDNSPMESFNSLLQIECVSYASFKTPEALKGKIDQYISYYNSERPNSNLNWISPDEYEEKYPVGVKTRIKE